MYRYVLLFLLLAGGLTGCKTEVLLNSTPQQAEVLLNGEPLGKTPLTTRLKWRSSQQLELRKPGYDTLRTNNLKYKTEPRALAVLGAWDAFVPEAFYLTPTLPKLDGRHFVVCDTVTYSMPLEEPWGRMQYHRYGSRFTPRDFHYSATVGRELAQLKDRVNHFLVQDGFYVEQQLAERLEDDGFLRLRADVVNLQQVSQANLCRPAGPARAFLRPHVHTSLEVHWTVTNPQKEVVFQGVLTGEDNHYLALDSVKDNQPAEFELAFRRHLEDWLYVEGLHKALYNAYRKLLNTDAVVTALRNRGQVQSTQHLVEEAQKATAEQAEEDELQAALQAIVSLESEGKWHGSAVVLSHDGLLATTYDLAQGHYALQVNFKDGAQATARIQALDPTSNLALLMLDTTGMKHLQLANLRLGEIEEVYALGVSALEADTWTLTPGKLKSQPATGQPGNTYLEYEPQPALPRGNVGGALVTWNGALLGILLEPRESDKANNRAFAIGIPTLMELLKEFENR